MFGEKEILTTMSMKDVKNLLEGVNSEPIFWTYQKKDKMLFLLRDYLQDQTKIREGVPVIFFDHFIPDEVQGDVFFINLKAEKIPEKKQSKKPEECPPVELLPELFQELKRFVPQEQEGAIFKAAALLLKPLAVKEGCSPEIWYEAASELWEDAQAMDVEEEMTEYFGSLLYQWQRKEKFHKVTAVSSYISLEREECSQWILYDEIFVFIPEKIFHEILEMARLDFSAYYVKKELWKAGILKSDAARGFTVKVQHMTADGSKYRSRYLKFQRNMLRKQDEIEFITTCKMKEDEND